MKPNKQHIPVVNIPHSRVNALHTLIEEQHNKNRLTFKNLQKNVAKAIHGSEGQHEPCWAMFSTLFAMWNELPLYKIQRFKETYLTEKACSLYSMAERLLNDVDYNGQEEDSDLTPEEIFTKASQLFCSLLRDVCGCLNCLMIIKQLSQFKCGLHRIPSLMPHAPKCATGQTLNALVRDFICHGELDTNLNPDSLIRWPDEFFDFDPETAKTLCILLACIYFIQFYFILREMILGDITTLQSMLVSIWSTISGEKFTAENALATLRHIQETSPMSTFSRPVTQLTRLDYVDRLKGKLRVKGDCTKFEELREKIRGRSSGRSPVRGVNDLETQLRQLDLGDSEKITNKRHKEGHHTQDSVTPTLHLCERDSSLSSDNSWHQTQESCNIQDEIDKGEIDEDGSESKITGFSHHDTAGKNKHGASRGSSGFQLNLDHFDDWLKEAERDLPLVTNHQQKSPLGIFDVEHGMQMPGDEDTEELDSEGEVLDDDIPQADTGEQAESGTYDSDFDESDTDSTHYFNLGYSNAGDSEMQSAVIYEGLDSDEEIDPDGDAVDLDGVSISNSKTTTPELAQLKTLYKRETLQ